MSDLEYKVGDFVKVFKGENTGFAGCVGIVLEANPELPYEYAILIDSKKRWFKESELELVQDGGAKVMKYKVGDRVQIIESNGTDNWFNPEAEVILGTVMVVNSAQNRDQYLVKVDDHVGIYDGGLFAFRKEHLVLIEREVGGAKVMKYKVGDQVKVIEDKETNYLGLVGYVAEINPDPLYEYAIWLDGNERWFKESELEGVSKDSIGDSVPYTSNPQKPIENDDTKQKVKSDGGSSSYYFSKLPQEVIEDIVKSGGIEIKDVVKYCYYNDADIKDIAKAIKRIMEDLRGGGKEGVDAQYDLNKIEFFFEEFKKSVLIQKREQEEAKDDW